MGASWASTTAHEFRIKPLGRAGEPVGERRLTVAARRPTSRRGARRSCPSARRATSWSWIVSRFTWRESTKSSSASPGPRSSRLFERDAHGVLDEARLEVRVLDDEELVGPLEELEHRCAHRALDEIDERLGVDRARRADEQRAAARAGCGSRSGRARGSARCRRRRSPPRRAARRPGRRRGPVRTGRR